MGDSFISGEGGRWSGNGSEPFGTRSGTDRAAFGCGALGCEYDPARVYGASEANDCHRSDVAPIESAPIAVEEKVNLACSGAKARDLWPAAEGGTEHFGEPPQADQLAAVARRDDVRMVVVTVGANDVGFGELVVDCALDWARSPEDEASTCHRDAEARIRNALPGATRAVTAALHGVRRTMRAAGYERSDYRLVAMGYASPFPEGQWFRYPEDGWTRLTEGGCPVWDADADWAADRATVDLAGMLREAAAATGAEYLDLADAFDGHQLCDRRAQRVGAGRPVPAHGRVVPPPLVRPRLDPRIPPPERLRPTGDGHLPRPPLRPPPRRLRLRRHPRRVARRHPSRGDSMSAAATTSPRASAR